MSLSESEIFEAGMSLSADARRHVALRLLQTVSSDEEFSAAAEAWLHGEVAATYDAVKADPSRAILADDVRAGFEAKWAARS